MGTNKSLERCLEKLDKIAKNLDTNQYSNKIKKYALHLFTPSRELAYEKYANAQYPGENDVTLYEDMLYNGGTFYIFAVGHAVAFIEFGSGITYDPDSNPLGQKNGIHSGMVSEMGYGNLLDKDWWIYRGEPGSNSDVETPRARKKLSDDDRLPSNGARGERLWTRGNPPAKGLYYASELIRTNAVPLANMYLKNPHES